jgi:hypothetical protein
LGVQTVRAAKPRAARDKRNAGSRDIYNSFA